MFFQGETVKKLPLSASPLIKLHEHKHYQIDKTRYCRNRYHGAQKQDLACYTGFKTFLFCKH